MKGDLDNVVEFMLDFSDGFDREQNSRRPLFFYTDTITQE